MVTVSEPRRFSREVIEMDTKLFDRNWKDLRAKIRPNWLALTEADVAAVDGNCEVLIELLREKYGYSRMQAESEVSRFLEDNVPAKG
jgi:hypothetical protein